MYAKLIKISKFLYKNKILAVFSGLILFLNTANVLAADNPLQLISDGNYHHYAGTDVEGFTWDIIFKDYFNDEWRMKKVREYGGVEYFVGNRYVPSSGKRYAVSASIYYSSQGDVISFASQNWQDEKFFVYNMVWQSNTRIIGCEYWVGADRWDGYYFRNAYIDLIKGSFGGRTIQSTSSHMSVNDATNTVAGVPQEVWANEDDNTLKMRLEPDRYEAVKKMRETMGIE